jgi:hypothetical protein
VEIKLLESSVITKESNELNVELQNKTTGPWLFGRVLLLEVKIGENWFVCETNESVTWPMDAYELDPGSSIPLGIRLGDYYPPLERGVYRLISPLYKAGEKEFHKAAVFEFRIK